MPEKKYTKEELQILQDLNKARAQELGILNKILDALSKGGTETKKVAKYNSDIADSLSAQAKFQEEGTKERKTYLNISERLNVLARLSHTHSNKSLGTLTKSTQIYKQIEEINNRIRLLGEKQNNINNKNHASYIADVKARNALNKSMNEQKLVGNDILKTLLLQADAAEMLEGRSNIFLDSFGGIAGVLKQIPLISGLAGPFEEAQKAAREATEEVVLYQKGLKDPTAYKGDKLKELTGAFGDVKVLSKTKT